MKVHLASNLSALADAVTTGLLPGSTPVFSARDAQGALYLQSAGYPTLPSLPMLTPTTDLPAAGLTWSGQIPLVEAIGPVKVVRPVGSLFPLRDEDAARADEGSVIFWVRDLALIPALVTRSLHLGNDKISLAALGASEGVLIRVDRPHSYLLQWAEDQPAGQADVFVAAAGPMISHVWVRRGFRLPTSAAWGAQDDRKTGWVLFQGDGTRLHVATPDWRGVYEAVGFRLEAAPLLEAQLDGPEATRWEVPLRMVPRHAPAPAELALLRQDADAELIYGLACRAPLDLRFCAMSAGQNAPRAVFLAGAHQAALPEAAPRNVPLFSRYKGLEGLFLPVDRALEPPVSREHLRRLFKLDGRHLTVLLPTGGLVRVPREGFGPMHNFGSALAQWDEADVLRVLSACVVDRGEYAAAGALPSLTRPLDRAQGPASSQAGAAGPRSAASPEPRTRRKLPPAPVVQAPVTPQAQAPAQGPGALEREETRLERLVIRRPASPAAWADLVSVKLQRNKWMEAMAASVEGRWCQLFPEEGYEGEDQVLEREGRSHVFLDSMDRALSEMGGHPAPYANLVAALKLSHLPPADQGKLLIAVSSAFRESCRLLGKKAQWMGWHSLLAVNSDVRLQEEVREALLSSLHKDGLSPADLPTFLRERLLKDPEVVLEGAEDLADQASDTQGLLRNLHVAEECLSRMQTPKIRAASMAALSRIYSQAGLPTKSEELLLVAVRAVASSMGAGPGAESASLRECLEAVQRAEAPSRNSSARLERWQAWVLLNACMITQRVNPALHPEALAAFNSVMPKLNNPEQEEMRQQRDSLERRLGQANIAEFLSQGSRSFFSTHRLPSEMEVLVTDLKRERRGAEGASEQAELVTRITAWCTRELGSKNTSLEMVSRLIMDTVQVLRKLKWDKDTRAVEAFEAFVRALPPEPTTREVSRLYFSVLHCATARAMMDLGREKDSLEIIGRIMAWLGRDYVQILDVVDLVKKEVLLTVEMAPRSARAEALRHLFDTLLAQERIEIGPDPSKPGKGFSLAYQAYEIILAIDHALEAAVSNEKFVLRKLREFEEREEARIRHWVQRDQPAAP